MQIPKTNLQIECHPKHVLLTIKLILLHDDGIFSTWFKQSELLQNKNGVSATQLMQMKKKQ
jgi:hypothetical protein